jgi:hypothetical protein
MFQLHPSNPFRPVNWRWERARLMRENKLRNTKRCSDPWVRSACDFQKGLTKCKDDIDRYMLMEQFPDIYGAYLMYQRGEEQEKHPMRFVVEARLLAAQTLDEIARLLGVPNTVIDAYTKLFFDVSEKLENTDYVMTCIIGPSVHAGLSDRDYDLLWKLFGYIYGPIALDAFIHMTSKRYRAIDPNQIDALLAEDARSSLQRKVAVVARTYTINPFSQTELLNIYSRFVELEKDSGGGSSRDVILQSVEVMMAKLPFKAGEENIRQTKAMNKYDATSIELHTNELMSVAMDGDVEDSDAFTDIKFPEPKKNGKAQ